MHRLAVRAGPFYFCVGEDGRKVHALFLRKKMASTHLRKESITSIHLSRVPGILSSVLMKCKQNREWQYKRNCHFRNKIVEGLCPSTPHKKQMAGLKGDISNWWPLWELYLKWVTSTETSQKFHIHPK